MIFPELKTIYPAEDQFPALGRQVKCPPYTPKLSWLAARLVSRWRSAFFLRGVYMEQIYDAIYNYLFDFVSPISNTR